MILTSSHSVSRNGAHDPTKLGGFYRLTVDFNHVILSTAFLAPYKMALEKQDIGPQVNGFQTQLPPRDTRHSTTALYRSTLFVSPCPYPGLPLVDVGLYFLQQCGGAQRRARPKALKRRRRRADRATQAGPSNRTGAQTAKKRKPGSRITKDFGGDGKALDDGTPGGPGTGFRKQARR